MRSCFSCEGLIGAKWNFAGAGGRSQLQLGNEGNRRWVSGGYHGGGAETDIECEVLDVSEFDALTAKNPALALKLLRNIAIEFSHTLRRSNSALRLYSR